MGLLFARYLFYGLEFCGASKVAEREALETKVSSIQTSIMASIKIKEEIHSVESVKPTVGELIVVFSSIFRNLQHPAQVSVLVVF